MKRIFLVAALLAGGLAATQSPSQAAPLSPTAIAPNAAAAAVEHVRYVPALVPGYAHTRPADLRPAPCVIRYRRCRY
jgi:hypothetical protein